MSESNDRRPDAATPGETRRRYTPPAIEESTHFETLALSCTKFEGECTAYSYPPGTPSGS